MLALSSLLRWNNRLYDRETRQGTWLWASTDSTWWSWVLDALSLTYKYKHYNSVKCSTLITDVHLFLLYFIFVDLGVSLFLLLAIPNLIFFLFNKGHTIWLGEWKKKKDREGDRKMEKERSSNQVRAQAQALWPLRRVKCQCCLWYSLCQLTVPLKMPCNHSGDMSAQGQSNEKFESRNLVIWHGMSCLTEC